MPRTIVVLPTYDEAENLPLIVPRILEQAGELDKETGVKGLSLLGADLKEPAELVAVAGDAVD